MTKKWWILVAVGCGTFMATLDSSIVNIALPTLVVEFKTSLFQVKWVVIAYLLGITCLLLPFGRLSDQYGRKKVFQYGFLTFVLGSALCGFAPGLGWLVLFRMVQAIGAAMLMANGPAIITASFPGSERGGALGALAMIVSAGLISGPSVGGILISELGWRSIFFVNIPVGLIGIWFAGRNIAKDSNGHEVGTFDWAGGVLQTILLVAFIILFDPPNISISGSMALPVPRWLIAAIVVIFGVIFIKVEAEARAPLLDLSLLRNKVFWTANVAGFLTFISYSSVTVLMPFFLEGVLHLSPKSAGLFMTVIPLTIFIVAPVSGKLSDRVGSQGLSFAGALVGTLGLFSMGGAFGQGGIQRDISNAAIVLLLCSIGLGTGLFQVPNNNAIMGAVPANKLGVASAMLATVRNLGLVTGTGLATTLFSWRMSVTNDFISSLHFTHKVAAFVGIGAMIAALAKGNERRSQPIKPLHGA